MPSTRWTRASIPRTYGHKQLSRMMNKLKDKFEMRTQDIEGQLIFYVKMKE